MSGLSGIGHTTQYTSFCIRDEHVDVWQFPQALFLPVKAGDAARSFRQIRANTAQQDDLPLAPITAIIIRLPS